MINRLKLIVFIAVCMLLAGCAARQVELSQNFWQNKKQKVTVAVDKLPKADFYQAGGGGVADFIINDVTESSMRDYIRHHYRPTAFSAIRSDFVHKLQAHGIDAKPSNVPINLEHLTHYGQGSDKIFARKDFRPLAAKLGDGKLLVLSINNVGISQKYFHFIPIGAPKAVCNAEGRLVDLKTNRILWRKYANEMVQIPGGKASKHNGPNVIKAIKQATSLARQDLINEFFMQIG